MGSLSSSPQMALTTGLRIERPRPAIRNYCPGISSCRQVWGIYTPFSVTAKWKTLRWAGSASLLLFAAGCGGIHASKSISPLDFLIPGGGGMLRGLLVVPPPAPPTLAALPDPEVSIVQATEIPKQVASVR